MWKTRNHCLARTKCSLRFALFYEKFKMLFQKSRTVMTHFNWTMFHLIKVLLWKNQERLENLVKNRSSNCQNVRRMSRTLLELIKRTYPESQKASWLQVTDASYDRWTSNKTNQSKWYQYTAKLFENRSRVGNKTQSSFIWTWKTESGRFQYCIALMYG